MKKHFSIFPVAISLFGLSLYGEDVNVTTKIMGNRNSVNVNINQDKNSSFYAILGYQHSTTSSKIENIGTDDEKNIDGEQYDVPHLGLGFGGFREDRFEIFFNRYSNSKKGVGVDYTWIYKKTNRFAPYISIGAEKIFIDDNEKEDYSSAYGGILGAGFYFNLKNCYDIQIGYQYSIHYSKLKRGGFKVCDPHSYYYEDCIEEERDKNDLEHFGSFVINFNIRL